MKRERPWIIAHRGARDEAPENTGSALKRAMELSVDGVEFDVQMSSDGVPVLYHDWTLFKISGRRKRISDLTRRELEQFDYGGWFRAPFSGEPLTTLRSALGLLRDCANICIEIKSHPRDQASGHAYRLTERVIELLNRSEMRDYRERVLILSFDPAVLARAHRMDAAFRYVLNLPEKKPIDAETATRHLWAVGSRISNLSAPLVRWARQNDLRVFTYTCNGPRQVRKAVKAGADAIITDRPAWLIQKLAKP